MELLGLIPRLVVAKTGHSPNELAPEALGRVLVADEPSDSAIRRRSAAPGTRQATVRESRIEVSLFPNWTGQRHRRLVKIDGDILDLAIKQPVRMGGERKSASLRCVAPRGTGRAAVLALVRGASKRRGVFASR